MRIHVLLPLLVLLFGAAHLLLMTPGCADFPEIEEVQGKSDRMCVPPEEGVWLTNYTRTHDVIDLISCDEEAEGTMFVLGEKFTCWDDCDCSGNIAENSTRCDRWLAQSCTRLEGIFEVSIACWSTTVASVWMEGSCLLTLFDTRDQRVKSSCFYNFDSVLLDTE